MSFLGVEIFSREIPTFVQAIDIIKNNNEG